MLTRQATDQHVELRLAVPPTGLREDSSQQDLCRETAASTDFVDQDWHSPQTNPYLQGQTGESGALPLSEKLSHH